MVSTEVKGNALAGVRCSIAPGSGNYHLRLAGCDDCTVRELIGMTLGQMEGLHQTGYVRQALYEAYMHVWATGAPRFSSLADGWTSTPMDPEVAALVGLFREVAGR